MANGTAPSISIKHLQEEHKALYDQALTGSSKLLKNEAEMKKFVAKVDELLKELTQLSAETESIEDYEWISDAALRWQTILSSVLNVSHSAVILSAPPVLKSTEPLEFFTDEELQGWLGKAAFEQSLVRRRKALLDDPSSWVNLRFSSEEERARDWHDVEILFVTKVLEGGIHLTRQLGSSSYHHLGQVWLEEVKRAKAFFIWESRSGDQSPPSYHDKDYLEACRQLRAQLARKDVKARVEEFEGMQAYLTERYLTAGTPAPAATDTSDTVESERYPFAPKKEESIKILTSKAFRLWQTADRNDPARDWDDALTYCDAFYSNIVPAVIEKDPEKKKEHTLRVLQTFEHGQVVNCFEVALAIYFLDADIVNTLWRDNEILWETTL